jgi:hypothetical protein
MEAIQQAVREADTTAPRDYPEFVDYIFARACAIDRHAANKPNAALRRDAVPRAPDESSSS